MSDIFTIGRRPEESGEWTSVRLKNVCRYVNRGVAPTYAEGESDLAAFSQKCVVGLGRVDTEFARSMEDHGEAQSEARLIAGDIVINATGTGTLGRVGIIPDGEGEDDLTLIADGHVTIVRTDEAQLLPSFLAYVLGTDAFYEIANDCLAVGSTNQMELGREPIRTLGLRLPSLTEQDQIVSALDLETSHIDELITEQDHQGDLLRERFVAEISMRTAEGRPWRLKHLIAEPLAYGAAETAQFNDPEWPRYIRTTDMTLDGRLRADTFFSLPPDVARPFTLRDGDLLLTRSGATVGKSFLYRDALGPACFAGYLIRVRTDPDKLLPAYLAFFARTKQYWEQVRDLTLQATIQNVSASRYAEFVVTVPTLDEQRDLVHSFVAAEKAMTSLLQEFDHQVSLLRERRQAVVTAAVSGGLKAIGRMVDA